MSRASPALHPHPRSRRGRVNGVVLALGLVIILPLLALFALSFGNDPRAVPSVLEGTQAPPFALTSLDGEPISLDALRGKPVVINFWSTWCGPCKQEHPALLDAARRHTDAAFLGVIYNDDPAKCRAWLQRNGQAYPTLDDPTGRTAIDFGVAGVPETYFIDAEGVIRHKHAGPLTPRDIAGYLASTRQPAPPSPANAAPPR